MIITCPNCSFGSTVGDQWAGKTVKCPSCRHEFLATDGSAAAARSVAIPGATSVCGECGTPTPASELADFGGTSVCARCKPLYVQRLMEGVGTQKQFQYGGFWIRFVAKTIDSVITGIGGALFGFALGVLLAGSESGELIATVILQLGGLAIGMAYSTWFVGRYGSTPGKMAFGLKVVKPDGSMLTYGQAFGRFWAEALSGLTLSIGYLIAAFDTEKRSLHDRICGTRVVKA